MLLAPPYSPEQVKSINVFQRLSEPEMFSRLTCKCSGLYYAREEGLTCKLCHHELALVPLFIANGTWNIFKIKQVEESEE